MRPIARKLSEIIEYLRLRGLSYREFASEVGYGYGAIQRAVKKIRVKRCSMKTERPRNLNESARRSIVRCVSSGKFDRAVNAARDCKASRNIGISQCGNNAKCPLEAVLGNCARV